MRSPSLRTLCPFQLRSPNYIRPVLLLCLTSTPEFYFTQSLGWSRGLGKRNYAELSPHSLFLGVVGMWKRHTLSLVPVLPTSSQEIWCPRVTGRPTYHLVPLELWGEGSRLRRAEKRVLPTQWDQLLPHGSVHRCQGFQELGCGNRTVLSSLRQENKG